MVVKKQILVNDNILLLKNSFFDVIYYFNLIYYLIIRFMFFKEINIGLRYNYVCLCTLFVVIITLLDSYKMYMYCV